METSIMGIYQIKNLENNKVYIGSSNDIHKRWLQHKTQLKSNKHHSSHLQHSFNKYGSDSFKFEIVEIITDTSLLLTTEQQWINKTKCCDQRFGYNISTDSRMPVTNSINYNKFNLVNRSAIEQISNLKLSINEKVVYYTLREYVVDNSNCVFINNTIPSISEMCDVIGLCDRTVRNVLNSLEEKFLIKKSQYEHRKAVYINPEYYAYSKNIEVTTLQLFDLSASNIFV